MGGFLKQSTASQSRLLGPFRDSTDGNTVEDGLSIANTDIRLSKNGGNMAAKNSGGGTHDELGYYTVTYDATDTDTVGLLQVSCHMSGALVVEDEFWVLEEAAYDALFAASAPGPAVAGDEMDLVDAPNATAVTAITTDVLTTQMTESYAANGVAPTLAQAQFAIHQMLMQFGISSTSLTVRKLDNSTTAFVVTLDDDTSPTGAART